MTAWLKRTYYEAWSVCGETHCQRTRDEKGDACSCDVEICCCGYGDSFGEDVVEVGQYGYEDCYLDDCSDGDDVGCLRRSARTRKLGSGLAYLADWPVKFDRHVLHQDLKNWLNKAVDKHSKETNDNGRSKEWENTVLEVH